MDDKILAAVDLGSNSFHLLIAKCEQSSFEPTKKVRQPVRLASHIDDKGYLSEEGQAIALSCLRHFREVLLDYPTIKIKAVATAAFRRIKAPTDFLTMANEALGQDIQVISGEDEARYIYYGVCGQLTPKDSISRLIIDIGGGSTEVVLGQGDQFLYIKSFPIGCVLLQKQFYATGAVTKSVISSMQQYVHTLLASGLEPLKSMNWMDCIASSGTAQTLKLLQKQQGINGAVTVMFANELLAQFGSGNENLTEYENVKPDRQLIFPAGLVILTTVLSILKIENIAVSRAALREGVLTHLLCPSK